MAKPLQTCVICDEPTGRCEEDSLYAWDGEGPLCLECLDERDEPVGAGPTAPCCLCGRPVMQYYGKSALFDESGCGPICIVCHENISQEA